MITPTSIQCKNIPEFAMGKGTWYQDALVITARISKEWGRYCFHKCLSVHISGRHTHLADREVPSSSRRGEGGLHLADSRASPSGWQGYPHPADGGYLHQDWMGVSPFRIGWEKPSPPPGMFLAFFSRRRTFLLIYLIYFWRTWGPLISLFWTSGDVCPDFQRQAGSFSCVLCHLQAMDS